MSATPKRSVWVHLRNLVFALAAGILMGLVYWLIQVDAPAPPWIALVGLAGILMGENAVIRLRRWRKERRAREHAVDAVPTPSEVSASPDSQRAVE